MADGANPLWHVMRLGDAALGQHFEAHALMVADRKWWPKIRQTMATLRNQGIQCECRESKGWFRRDFFIRCDNAALPALQNIGNRMRDE